MTKAPRAGKVKTRLSPPLQLHESAGLNICFLRDTAAAIHKIAEHGHVRGIGVFTPDGSESAYEGILPESFELVPQRGDAFGERLFFASEDLFALGFDSVCLIDSDSPTLPPEIFARAVQLLAERGDRLVIGPSDDGGYYLIGLKKNHRRLFQEIDWSTERVFAQTIERAAEINLAVCELPRWYDVDDPATLRRLCENLLGPQAKETAPATKALLERLIAGEGRERIWPNDSANAQPSRR